MSTPAAFSRPVELALYATGPATALLTAPLLAHGLGAAGRGQYAVAVAVGTLAFTLGGWGQGPVYLAEQRKGRGHYAARTRISWCGGACAAALCLVTLLAFGLPLTVAMSASLFVPLLALTPLWQAAAISANSLRPVALSSAVGSGMKAIILSVLFYVSWLTAETATSAYLGCIAVGSVLTVGVAARRLRPKKPDCRTSSARLAKQGVGIVVFSLLNAIFLRADILVLQALSTPTQVGVYAAPASLATASLALAAAYKPRFQAAVIAASRRAMRRELSQVAILGLLGSLVVWLSAPILVPILFGNEFRSSEAVLRILAFAIVPLLLVDLFYGGLVASGKRRELVIVSAASSLFLLALLTVLSPPLGARGAALAVCATYAVTAVMAWRALTAKELRPGAN